MKRRYSIEYVDRDGDGVITHGDMTPSEASELVREAAARGVRMAVHDLTPPQAVAVISANEEVPQLGEDAEGRVE